MNLPATVSAVVVGAVISHMDCMHTFVRRGRKSNAQLLMLYGFSMERNTQDFCSL